MNTKINCNWFVENETLSSNLLSASLPKLLSTVDLYVASASKQCTVNLQSLLLGELSRRIRNINRLSCSTVQLVDTSAGMYFESLVSAVRGDECAEHEFNAAFDLQDQLWSFTETIYWNCARCIAILYGDGLSKTLAPNGMDLPGLPRLKKPFINVSFVRHKLIEHPEVFGGSLSLGVGTSGPLLGEKGNFGMPCDMGLYANIIEFVDLVCSRLNSANLPTDLDR